MKHASSKHLALSAIPLTALALGSIACEAPPDAREPVETVEAAQPIIEGTADTEHPAVVWLYDSDGGSSCTGTIVAVDGTTGYVLTAAHCADMKLVAVTTDFRSCFGDTPEAGCEALFTVYEQVYHPGWTGEVGEGSADFSMLRFVGAGPTTPVIPAAASDDGVAGSVPTDVVGFGETELGDNTRRNHKVTPISEVTDDLFSTVATTCFGDSGGPAIVDGRVVGVTSFGIGKSCFGDGYSGRVESVYDDFIRPFIEQDPIVIDCNQCLEIATETRGGPCGQPLADCDGDGDCRAIRACVAGCVGNTGCESQCPAAHPAGAALYDAIFRCISCDACVDTCGEDPRCDEPPPVAASSGSGIPIDGATTTGAGTGAGGEGGASGDDSAAASDDDGCSVAHPGAPSSSWGIALAALAASWLRRRRPERP